MSTPTAPSGPLMVVSNRLPLQAERHGGRVRFTQSPGGLVSALEAVMRDAGGVWVGWPGTAQEAGEEDLAVPPAPGLTYHPVALSGRELQLYYGGFCNRTLWPLFHYFVGRTQIDAQTWRAYERVNDRFAAAAAAAAGDDTLVWVHDYQLLRVPALLRRRAPRRRIALFLHVPFPATDVFRVLPWSQPLLRGLLAADFVGLQTGEHVEHFLTCAGRLLACEADRGAGLVHYEGRDVGVRAHPISIDVAQVERYASAGPAPPRRNGRLLEILGVDRLDYTKGIAERLLAIERLLQLHPSYRRRFVFTQVGVPSRERIADYQALKRQIDELVGRINGRYSDRGWAPIRYLTRALPPAELGPLYRAADVALVTPLRDGMNLVAKEYVAAQVDGDGVLVLSELAGAATELPEALIVNPYDVDAVAEALHRALTMSEEERRARMRALRDRVRSRDVHAWVREFLAAAGEACRRRPAATPVDRVRAQLARWLARRPAVALFLDYDGTLTAIAPRPEDASLSDESRRVLADALGAPGLDVTVISGRALTDVRDKVGLDGLTYVGDHGFEIEGPGLSWRHPGVTAYQASLDQAARELEALGIPGGWVERKTASVSYHVRAVAAEDQRGAASRAEAVLRRRRLAVVTGKAVVEGRAPLGWHKGQGVLHVLRHRYGEHWSSRAAVLYIGDDATDEDAFRALRGIGRSILVAPSGEPAATAADLVLPGPEDVVAVVRWLASGAWREARP
ncbi:MAG: bifunctional alpha,alpha-trehalose-phosphate synthase (UDP-forming)/trehalose-phosphatase [Gemmatimonadetes bacterium]|nr:bifunctional alpha,alpha-trehalose-phosphate synthase (UDP-forming)/trehalose-phosphatase [Gemmatimonadota bacterium]